MKNAFTETGSDVMDDAATNIDYLNYLVMVHGNYKSYKRIPWECRTIR